jgi:flavin-binding protein dodecin
VAGEDAPLGAVPVCVRSLYAVASSNPTPERHMAESVYKVIELVGTSPDSWEKAAAAAVQRAAKSLRDLRVAEVSQLDMQLKDGKIESYRAKVKVSFKYEGG